MSYLKLARSVAYGTSETRKAPIPDRAARRPSYEENEENEERSDQALLTPEESKRLKQRIIDVVTVEPSEFDRADYDRLWARWMAHEAAGGE